MRSSIAAIGLGVIALAAPPVTVAAPIPEYRALYRTIVDGATVTADVSLSYDSVAGEYTLGWNGVDESSHEYVTTLQFQLVEDKVRPVAYRQQWDKCAACYSTIALRFNWETGRVESRFHGSRNVQPLSRNLARDLATLVATLPGRRELEGFDDVLSADSLEMVELTTPIGPVHADRVVLRGAKQPHPDGDVWLAHELEDLPVRIDLSSGKTSMLLELAELRGIELSAVRGGATAAEE
ncbi:MAG TPA: hypothetical protein VE907_11975 [Gammaproteobacteria bacterium]|nr:hypothetical protein [Gammaproteobacteria bacterium]